jgi:hypothetical protein
VQLSLIVDKEGKDFISLKASNDLMAVAWH